MKSIGDHGLVRIVKPTSRQRGPNSLTEYIKCLRTHPRELYFLLKLLFVHFILRIFASLFVVIEKKSVFFSLLHRIDLTSIPEKSTRLTIRILSFGQSISILRLYENYFTFVLASKLLKSFNFVQMSMINFFDALICTNVDLSISMKPADANRVQDGFSSQTSIYRNLSYTR